MYNFLKLNDIVFVSCFFYFNGKNYKLDTFLFDHNIKKDDVVCLIQNRLNYAFKMHKEIFKNISNDLCLLDVEIINGYSPKAKEAELFLKELYLKLKESPFDIGSFEYFFYDNELESLKSILD